MDNTYSTVRHHGDLDFTITHNADGTYTSTPVRDEVTDMIEWYRTGCPTSTHFRCIHNCTNCYAVRVYMLKLIMLSSHGIDIVEEETSMAWIDGKMWDVLGTEPTDDELTARMNDYQRDPHNPQLGHKLMCPNCEQHNTRWLRHQYWMCFDCHIWFTIEDAQPVYNVAEYKADSRLDESYYT